MEAFNTRKLTGESSLAGRRASECLSAARDRAGGDVREPALLNIAYVWIIVIDAVRWTISDTQSIICQKP